MENTSSKVMKPLLIRRGEVLPETVVPMTTDEVLRIQNKRINSFVPKSEMLIFHYGYRVLGATAAASGFVLHSIFRKNFRLGGLKMIFTYGASIVIPSAFSAGLHEMCIKPEILLGMESCPTCLTLKSGFFQSLMGLCYPYILSILTCLPTAREYYTLDKITVHKGLGYFRLLRQVSPSSSVLLTIGFVNMLIGTEVCRQEIQTYIKHLSKPPSYSVSEYDNLLND